MHSKCECDLFRRRTGNGFGIKREQRHGKMAQTCIMQWISSAWRFKSKKKITFLMGKLHSRSPTVSTQRTRLWLTDFHKITYLYADFHMPHRWDETRRKFTTSSIFHWKLTTDMTNKRFHWLSLSWLNKVNHFWNSEN